MFTTVIDAVKGVTLQSFALCAVVSLALGLLVAGAYILQGSYTKSFVITLAALPIIVQVIIMMVNGNIGTGVAVLGAFSLIRFRSVPGSSREIIAIFFSMAVGLITGMGYLGIAAIAVVIIGVFFIILYKIPFGEKPSKEKRLKITIPENLDYTGVFDDLFKMYTSKVSLEKVKTTNLGTMYELTYTVSLKNTNQEKELIDAIRCRNGNLTVICGKLSTVKEEL